MDAIVLFQQNRSLQVTNAELLKEVDRLDRQIKDEQQRAVHLRTELRNGSRSTTVVHEVRILHGVDHRIHRRRLAQLPNRRLSTRM